MYMQSLGAVGKLPSSGQLVYSFFEQKRVNEYTSSCARGGARAGAVDRRAPSACLPQQRRALDSSTTAAYETARTTAHQGSDDGLMVSVLGGQPPHY
jgi:hypothetical protein